MIFKNNTTQQLRHRLFLLLNAESDRPFCRTYKAVEVLRTMFKEQLTVAGTQNTYEYVMEGTLPTPRAWSRSIHKGSVPSKLVSFSLAKGRHNNI
jgi:hypothetical protein